MLDVTADFGASGCPGTFHLFYFKGVVQMARAEMVLTLPMAVYVDDNMLMGSDRAQVDAEMESFQEWALDIVGLVFKVAKVAQAGGRTSRSSLSTRGCPPSTCVRCRAWQGSSTAC